MRFSLLLMFSFVLSISFAQGFKYDKLYGYAIDSISKKPIGNVRIVARDSNNRIMYEKISSDNGYFELTSDIEKIATVTLEHTSYINSTFWMLRTVFSAKSFDTVLLAPKSKTLKALALTTSKSPFRQKTDRDIFDIQSDYIINGKSSFDIIRNPL